MLLFKFPKEHALDVNILGDEFELYQDVASLTTEKEALDWMKDKCFLCIRALSQGSSAKLEILIINTKRGETFMIECD